MTLQIFPFTSLSPDQQREASSHHDSRPAHKYALIKIENHDEDPTIYDVAYDYDEALEAQTGEPDYYQAVVIPDDYPRVITKTPVIPAQCVK